MLVSIYKITWHHMPEDCGLKITKVALYIVAFQWQNYLYCFRN